MYTCKFFFKKIFYLRSLNGTVPQSNGPATVPVRSGTVAGPLILMKGSRNGPGQATAATFNRKNHCIINILLFNMENPKLPIY